jgi:hypothetical protein
MRIFVNSAKSGILQELSAPGEGLSLAVRQTPDPLRVRPDDNPVFFIPHFRYNHRQEVFYS